MNKEVAKNTEFNTLNTKVNNLEKKTSDVTTLIQINQYNAEKLNLKKIEDIDKKIPNTNGLMTTIVLNAKTKEVENKKTDTSGLVTTAVLETKI